MKPQSLLKLIFVLGLSLGTAFAGDGDRLAIGYGYFSLNAKVNEASTTVSNPSAFRLTYLRPMTQSLEFFLGYSVLLADFTGSDLGFGFDAGVNYYLLGNSREESYKDQNVEIRRFDLWKPYVGLGFHQRNFQSVKNSFAGLGVSLGVERYLTEKYNVRTDARYLSLGGSGESTATELGFFVGLVVKL